MSGRTRGRSRLSVRYFDDRILLTESHAWAYYRLPTHSYEFLTPPEREALAINITVALAAIRLPDIIAQNVVSSLLNSHLFDFHEGWIYVLGVGVAGGMALRQRMRTFPRVIVP